MTSDPRNRFLGDVFSKKQFLRSSLLALRTLQLLLEADQAVELVISRGAFEVWRAELGLVLPVKAAGPTAAPDVAERPLAAWAAPGDLRITVIACSDGVSDAVPADEVLARVRGGSRCGGGSTARAARRQATTPLQKRNYQMRKMNPIQHLLKPKNVRRKAQTRNKEII